jgi:hypothetical protein
VAEALDVTRGVFSRASHSSYGYGGTRYFPLFFFVHRAAIKLFGAWRQRDMHSQHSASCYSS